jgi:prepilin-type N-terminal cleavage/methylation domain-containing protein
MTGPLCFRQNIAERNQHRRGWTLVEMMVCLTIGTLVFAAAVELLGLAMHADSSEGRAAEDLQSLDRLAEQFTADVRSAIEVRTTAPANAATSWTIQLSGDHRIDYALQEHALLRTAYRADKVTQREAFALGDDLTARLELRPTEQPTKAALVLERVADGIPRPVDRMRIVVPVGWARRFAATAENQKIE